MIRAPLWQVAEKGKPAFLKILNVQKQDSGTAGSITGKSNYHN